MRQGWSAMVAYGFTAWFIYVLKLFLMKSYWLSESDSGNCLIQWLTRVTLNFSVHVPPCGKNLNNFPQHYITMSKFPSSSIATLAIFISNSTETFSWTIVFAGFAREYIQSVKYCQTVDLHNLLHSVIKTQKLTQKHSWNKMYIYLNIPFNNNAAKLDLLHTFWNCLFDQTCLFLITKRELAWCYTAAKKSLKRSREKSVGRGWWLHAENFSGTRDQS